MDYLTAGHVELPSPIGVQSLVQRPRRIWRAICIMERPADGLDLVLVPELVREARPGNHGVCEALLPHAQSLNDVKVDEDQ